jgi:hypothetical protein
MLTLAATHACRSAATAAEGPTHVDDADGLGAHCRSMATRENGLEVARTWGLLMGHGGDRIERRRDLAAFDAAQLRARAVGSRRDVVLWESGRGPQSLQLVDEALARREGAERATGPGHLQLHGVGAAVSGLPKGLVRDAGRGSYPWPKARRRE